MHCSWYPSMPCSRSPGGLPGPEGVPGPSGVSLVPGGSPWSGGLLGPRGVPAPGGWRPPTQQMATVADGTHPTGMHSRSC